MLGSFPDMFYLVCIGQAICAWGQPFIQNSPVSLKILFFTFSNFRNIHTL